MAVGVGGVDGSVGVTTDIETNVRYQVRPWVGWLQSDHWTLGMYGHLAHRRAYSSAFTVYGPCSLATSELLPPPKLLPYATLAAGMNYAHWRVHEPVCNHLYPRISPEVGIRWHVTGRFAISAAYRYDFNLGQGFSGRRGMGQFTMGLRFTF
jgi:hypothetical protein